MQQAIIDLYDRYTHGTMGRRAFLKRLTTLAGGTVAASALLPLLENNYTQAAVVAEDDPRLQISRETFELDGGRMGGYLVRPVEAADSISAVMVIHENRGLNPHIEDVTRRIGLAGLTAFAPDVLMPEGGTPSDSDEARTEIRALSADASLYRMLASKKFLNRKILTLQSMRACAENAVNYSRAAEVCTGRIAAIGFCWGGGMVNRLAVADEDLTAGVAYYGRQAPVEDVPKIKASLMLHYAGEDTRINAGIPDFEAALEAAGTDYHIHMYEGAQHAFNNDTNEARYNADAATLAWDRTIAFLKEKIG